ncbi:MAG: DNA-3-methyladenine glycosylase [Asticcacaulis sp. 32-58-5]|nr:MAG: DNA-3-methyladenine glycosylase [Asticcacaulis sp. 32-58-5]
MRCPWAEAHPEYGPYHDHEWGTPVYESRALYEKLVLDGFQAGLSWITVLRKREALREAFQGFDPEIVARYDDAEIEHLMNDARIIRSRTKINSAIHNARITLKLRDQGIELVDLIWGAQDYKPQINHYTENTQIPAQTDASVALSKLLKSKGYKFCGPTIVYAFMQAVGLVNDHLISCGRHQTLKLI